MNKLEILKTAVGLVVSVGVGTVVGNAIKATTPLNQNLLNRSLVKVGAFFVGGVLSEAAFTSVEKTIDNVAEKVQSLDLTATPEDED